MRLALIVSHAEVSGTVPTELSYLRIIILFKVKTGLGVTISSHFHIVILKKMTHGFITFLIKRSTFIDVLFACAEFLSSMN